MITKWNKFFRNISDLYHFNTELYASMEHAAQAAEESKPLLSQSSIVASFAGWDSSLLTGASPYLPTNGDINIHPYIVTYCNESGANVAMPHAHILSTLSPSEHLRSARFESLAGALAI
jgi:hypothetical protein